MNRGVTASSTSGSGEIREPVVSAAPPSGIREACQAWEDLLGAENAFFSGPTLSKFSRTSSPAAHSPIALLRPSSTEEVREILTIAVRFGIPVHPVSRGKNWGYGDACPTGPAQAVVDLSRMN